MLPKKDEIWRQFVQTKHPKLREKLILDHISLVKYVVGRIAGSLPPSVERDDLVGSGILGLIAAVDRFDPSRGLQFETYATSKIKGAILDGLRALDWVPRSVRYKARLLETTMGQLENELGRTATEEEIAERLGVGVEKYRNMLQDASPVLLLSLDEPFSTKDENVLSLRDVIEDDRSPDPTLGIEREEMKEILVNAIRGLPERGRLIVILYYYEGLTLKEISRVIGVSESRVSQIHTEVILRLRSMVTKAIGVTGSLQKKVEFQSSNDRSPYPSPGVVEGV